MNARGRRQRRAIFPAPRANRRAPAPKETRGEGAKTAASTSTALSRWGRSSRTAFWRGADNRPLASRHGKAPPAFADGAFHDHFQEAFISFFLLLPFCRLYLLCQTAFWRLSLPCLLLPGPFFQQVSFQPLFLRFCQPFPACRPYRPWRAPFYRLFYRTFCRPPWRLLFCRPFYRL